MIPSGVLRYCDGDLLWFSRFFCSDFLFLIIFSVHVAGPSCFSHKQTRNHFSPTHHTHSNPRSLPLLSRTSRVMDPRPSATPPPAHCLLYGTDNELALRPPLIVENLLPYDMEVELYDGEASVVQRIGVAQRASIARFDMTRRIKLRVRKLDTSGTMEGEGVRRRMFKSSSSAVVWYPRNFRSGVVEAGRKLTHGNLPTSELPESLTLIDTGTATHSPMRSVIKLQIQHRVRTCVGTLCLHTCWFVRWCMVVMCV